MYRFLLYLLLLAGLAVFSVLYIDSFAVILLFCVLAIPALLGLSFLVTRRKGRASLSCSVELCRTGDSIPVTLSVENRGILPFSHMQAEVLIKHQLGNIPETLTLRFPLQARNLTRVTFYVRPACPGMLDIRMKRLFLWDYFHLFSMKFPMPEHRLTLVVLPQPAPVTLTLSAPAVYMPEGEVFGDRPGDDPSEIFGLRDYREGDLMSRIHWKLSARRDELIFKEFSLPEERRILVLLDCPLPESASEERAVTWNAAASFFYAVCEQLLAKGEAFRLVWLHYNLRLHAETLTHGDGLFPAFRRFYEEFAFMPIRPEKFREFAAREPFSSAVCLTSELTPTLLETMETVLEANRKTIVCIGSEPTLSAEHTAILHIPVPVPEGMVPQLTL